MNKNRKAPVLVVVSIFVLIVVFAVVAFSVFKNISIGGDTVPLNPVDESSQELKLSFNQKGSILAVSITPTALIEDSRCPSNVVCVWAGTVKVRALLESGLGKANQIFELNMPITTEAEEITLIDVLPGTVVGETIATSSYRFVFRVKDRKENSSVSMAGITFSYPDDFGLAVTRGQVLVMSYIPTCEDDFDYCLYYDGTEYEGTNFDSAGVRIKKRTDITYENACLNMPPVGYTSLVPRMDKKPSYATSVFSPVGDAGLGHYAKGSVYRLFMATTTCLEFETRIGESQFANYEPGTIEEFTEAKRSHIENKLKTILGGITIVRTGEKVVFPR